MTAFFYLISETHETSLAKICTAVFIYFKNTLQKKPKKQLYELHLVILSLKGIRVQ